MRTPLHRRCAWLGSIAIGLALLAPIPAHGAALSLTARTVYQGSQLRLRPDRDFEGFRNVNLFAEWLELGGYAFGPGGDFDALVSVRYRTDFGTGFHRDTLPGAGIPVTDGRDDLELPYFYLEWRNVIPERLDLRLGRQLILDDLDWFSLDGLLVTTHLYRGANVHVYAGMPVPFEIFASSEPFLYDGLEIQDGPQLTFGGSADWLAGQDFSFSLAYRHTFTFRNAALDLAGRPFTPGEGNLVNAVAGATRGVAESTLGTSLGYTVRDIDLDLSAHLVWSFLFGNLDQARLAAGWTPTEHLRAEIEYLRIRPRFAADSIFNFFNIRPYDRARAGAAVEVLEGLWLDAGYFLHAFHGSAKNGQEFLGSDLAHGPSLTVSYRGDFYGVGASAETSTNFGGNYAYGGNYRMFELFGHVGILDERLVTTLRLNYTGAQTDWFAGNDSGAVSPEEVSFGLHLGLTGRITEGLLARVDFVKNFESVIEGSYRVQSYLEVRYP